MIRLIFLLLFLFLFLFLSLSLSLSLFLLNLEWTKKAKTILLYIIYVFSIINNNIYFSSRSYLYIRYLYSFPWLCPWWRNCWWLLCYILFVAFVISVSHGEWWKFILWRTNNVLPTVTYCSSQCRYDYLIDRSDVAVLAVLLLLCLPIVNIDLVLKTI